MQIVKIIPLNTSEEIRFNKLIKNNLIDVKIPKEYMIYPFRENSLLKTHPQLLVYWDYNKNNEKDVLPEHLTIGQNVRVHWKWPCCGMDWPTTPLIKLKNLDECKKCRNLIAKKVDETDLINYWNYNKNLKKPSEVSSKSTEKYWWNCKYCNTIFTRTPCLMMSGSFNCGNHGCEWSMHNSFGVLKSKINQTNTIGYRFKLLSVEWMESKNGISSYEIPCGTNKKAWWKCSECSYEWMARIDSRTNNLNPSGCPMRC
jgi:hypothetical protein